MTNIIAGIRGPGDAFDHQKYDVLTAEDDFPGPTAGFGSYDEIWVQALESNPGVVTIGKTGVLADGSAGGVRIIQGGLYPLPFKDHTQLKIIAAETGNDLLIMFFRRDK